MVKPKHRLLSNFFSHLSHIPQSHLINILCKISIRFNRIKFWFELCIYTGIELHTITSCCFPLQQLIMNFTILYFLLTCLDLFDNPLFFRKLLVSFPKNLTISLDLFNRFSTYQLGYLRKILSTKLFTSCNKIVKIILRPFSKTCFQQLIFKLLLLFTQRWICLSIICTLVIFVIILFL